MYAHSCLGLTGSLQFIPLHLVENRFKILIFFVMLICILFIHSQKEEVPPHYGDYTPDHKVIYKFIKTLFHAAQVKLWPSNFPAPPASHFIGNATLPSPSHFPLHGECMLEFSQPWYSLVATLSLHYAKKKKTLRFNQVLNLGHLATSQMLLPTKPLDLWHWRRGIDGTYA